MFVKGVAGRTKLRGVMDSTKILELLDGGMDMWAAVNGKRVNMHDIVAGVGICDRGTIWCYGRLKGGAQRYRQPPQDIPGQWTCWACGQERVVANESSVLSVRKAEGS